MRSSILLILLLITLGCKQSITTSDLKGLNGYWEIQKVEFPNGQTKDYTISTTIDYIEIDNTRGFRKKVHPQLNGSFRTSDDAEMFTIQEVQGTFLIIYEQGLEQWEETLKSIEEDTFSVKNSDGKTYYYKRYEPLNLGL